MVCPHCHVNFEESWKLNSIANDPDGKWRVGFTKCVECQRVTLKLVNATSDPAEDVIRFHPLADVRPPIPANVPDHIASDYREACLVLSFSEKASAALSRRCLQTVLREIAKVRAGKLAAEIEAVIRSGQVPSHLADDLHAIREIGNLAAHPIKNENTGQIIDVEPHEAEWLLNVLEELFDWYFVQLPRRQNRRDALNQKLAKAGRAPLRTT